MSFTLLSPDDTLLNLFLCHKKEALEDVNGNWFIPSSHQLFCYLKTKGRVSVYVIFQKESNDPDLNFKCNIFANRASMVAQWKRISLQYRSRRRCRFDPWVGQEEPLEEGMATHPSVLSWRILWTEKPGGLWSIGLQRIGHNWSDFACTHALRKISFKKATQAMVWENGTVEHLVQVQCG